MCKPFFRAAEVMRETSSFGALNKLKRGTPLVRIFVNERRRRDELDDEDIIEDDEDGSADGPRMSSISCLSLVTLTVVRSCLMRGMSSAGSVETHESALAVPGRGRGTYGTGARSGSSQLGLR